MIDFELPIFSFLKENEDEEKKLILSLRSSKAHQQFDISTELIQENIIFLPFIEDNIDFCIENFESEHVQMR